MRGVPEAVRRSAPYLRAAAAYHALRRHPAVERALDVGRFPGARVDRSAVIRGRRNLTLGPGAEVQAFVVIHAIGCRVRIGANSQVNPFTVIYGTGGVEIGANVMIAPHCMLTASNHDFVQTAVPMRFAGIISRGPIVIEDDVWIAAHCTITDGVRIGTGAVVAANSVVTRDVAPFDVVAGAPARVIGSRRSWRPRPADGPGDGPADAGVAR